MSSKSPGAGRNEAAVLPDGWAHVRLGEVFEHVVDTGHTDELPILSVTMSEGVVHRSSLARQSEREVAREKHLKVAPGDIAYNTMRMWQGASGLIHEDGYLSPAYTVCRPGSGESAEYWAHCFKFDQMIKRFQDYSQGLTGDRLRLYFKHFAAVPAIRPPLPEQRKIAAILSSVDEVIEKTEALIAQLQVVKKATMQELLTRGLPRRRTGFKQTEIGEIPEEWEVVPMADCVRERIRNGYSPVCPKVPTGKWTLGLGAVGFDGFDPGAVKSAPRDDPKVDDSQLIPGDLLLSRSNTRERVGLVGIYRGVPSPCSYPDLLMRIRPNDRTTPEFLELTLLSARGRDYFESAARGTSGSMVKVNRGIVEKFLVALPPSNEQDGIVEAGAAFDRRRDAENAVLAQLRIVKTSLMSVLLSGGVRVGPNEVAA